MKLAAAILAACAPSSLGLSLVAVPWTTDGEPPNGYTEMIFSITMKNVSHQSGYFFAQQFTFRGIDQVAQIGLQPREDKDGKSVIHAVFSSFQNGTKSRDKKKCKDGADGGPGVSCGVDFSGEYNETYFLTIRRTLPRTWLGLVRPANASENHVKRIGQWTLPRHSGLIKKGEVGFVEYRSATSSSCKSLPKAEVLFGHPYSNSKGANGGRLMKPYEYGDCLGSAGFSATKSYEGWTIKLGFS